MAKKGNSKYSGKPVNGTDDGDVLSTSNAAMINGGDGADLILGSEGADDIRAGDGDDTISGGAGDDTIFGNDGTDTAMIADLSSMSIAEGKGNSWIMTSSDGVDTLKHIEFVSDGTFTYTIGENNGVFGLGDSGATDEDTAITIDLFENSFDVEGDGYSVTSVDLTGTAGSVSVSAGGIASYDPGAAFQSLAVGESATDSFSYTVTDDAGNVSTQTVSVTISGVNDAPIATGGDTSGAVSEDDVLTASGTVTASDVDASDTLSWSIDGSGVGTYGSLSMDANGDWTYTLDNDSSAVQDLNDGDVVTDSFSVEVSDGNGGTASQTVSIDVSGADDGNGFPEAPDPNGVTILTDVNELGSWGATSGWQTKSFTVDAAGDYQIAFGAANFYDWILDGNLWIDNLQAGDQSFGFESGLSGWDTIGNVSTTTATQTEGSYSAQLHTGEAGQASMESFLGGADLPNQTSVGSAMSMTVSLEAGDTVSFDWRFDVSDYMPYNDYAFYMAELI